jgi:hypothetical protein
MDGTGDHHVNLNKPDSERQISRFLSYTEFRSIITSKINGPKWGTIGGS